MLVSVDSVFDVLDRRIAATTAKVLLAMPDKMTAEERLAARRPEAVAPLGMLQLLRESAIEKALAPPAVPAVMAATAGASPTQQSSSSSQTAAPAAPVPVPGSIADAASAFQSFEATLADTEATLRRTLTNGTFGPGPAMGAGQQNQIRAPSASPTSAPASASPTSAPASASPTSAPASASPTSGPASASPTWGWPSR